MRRRSAQGDEVDSALPAGIAEALETLPLFDDLYLGMQAINLDLIDRFLVEQEDNLLREYMRIERTPSLEAMFVSALSQLWLFGLYELLRTWRQRCKDLLRWHEELQGVTAEDRDTLVVTEKGRILQRSAAPIGGEVFHWEPYERVAEDPSFGDVIRKSFDQSERLFRRSEAFRITLAKHEVPKAHGSFARAPGYGRIDMMSGSMFWEVILGGKEVDRISRREVANQCRGLGQSSNAVILPKAIQEKILRFPSYSYGVKRVTLTLDDGSDIKGVYVSWSKEVIGVHGRELAFLKADRIVDARPEPGELGDEISETKKRSKRSDS
jgi:hypothetical protein